MKPNLNLLYKSFNKLAFDNKLPLNVIEIDSKAKMNRNGNCYCAYFNTNDKKIYFIKEYIDSIKPSVKTATKWKLWGSLNSFMIHEMTHLYLWLNGHNASCHDIKFWRTYREKLECAGVKSFKLDWASSKVATKIFASYKPGRKI